MPTQLKSRLNIRRIVLRWRMAVRYLRNPSSKSVPEIAQQERWRWAGRKFCGVVSKSWLHTFARNNTWVFMNYISTIMHPHYFYDYYKTTAVWKQWWAEGNGELQPCAAEENYRVLCECLRSNQSLIVTKTHDKQNYFFLCRFYTHSSMLLLQNKWDDFCQFLAENSTVLSSKVQQYTLTQFCCEYDWCH